MKCPILIKVTKRWFRPPVYEPVDCLKEECAWWDKSIGACAVLGLDLSLSLIGGKIFELVDKMHHEKQFRR